MIERTLVLIKPDAVQRGLIGEITSRFEKAGLKIAGMKMKWIDKDFSKKHYHEHVEKHFYPLLEEGITEGPVVAMAIEGVQAVQVVRKMTGDTIPHKAAPGTIRGDYTHLSAEHADSKKKMIKNVVHASGSKEEADHELKLWFDDSELHTYRTVHEIHTQFPD